MKQNIIEFFTLFCVFGTLIAAGFAVGFASESRVRVAFVTVTTAIAVVMAIGAFILNRARKNGL